GTGLYFAPTVWQTVGSLCLIGFVGFPHGGIDGYQMWSYSGGDLKRFAVQIAKYLAISLGAWSAWWVWPAAFWALFLALSIYHFGVSKDLFPARSPAFRVSKWVSLISKGVLVVIVPIVSYPASANDILAIAASPAFAQYVVDLAPTALLVVLSAVLVIATIELRIPAGRAFARTLLLQSLLLLILFGLLPVLVSFALYFVFIHAIPQMRERRASFPEISARALFAFGAAFSLPPLALFAFALGQEPSWASWASQGSAYIFVVLAVLHFPHCWLSFTES
ncbi:MAG: Brp/Blh family beta-carotene 15,15'-dioxygenase, partial [Oligoflexus sp.]|nr:Brp/Blh family beta-carotene 15,15'-dioxygenase [Oligoflexus sp.]